MSAKTYKIVIGIIGAVGTAAGTIVTLFNPEKLSTIIAIIGAVTTLATEIATLFVKKEEEKQ
jgi:uncharacterized membrane protein YeaQ/YmgE (transglycosylase-associated protein family)